MVSGKISKIIGLLHKLQNLLPRGALITIYRELLSDPILIMVISFTIKHMSFHQKLKSIRYNAYLAITEAIQGTSKEKLYQELSLESLRLRRWYRKLGMFYKIFKTKSSQFVFKLIPEKTSSYTDNIPLFNIKHNFYKNFFFPSTIIEWNNLDSTFGIQKILVFSKIIFLNLLDPNQFS